MNDKVVIFVHENRNHVLMPAMECGLTVEQIASKDVPAGVPYKIIDRTDLPTDLIDMDTWDIDVSQLTDGVGGA